MTDYADLDAATRLLAIDPDDPDEAARLDALNAVLSRLFEDRVGRTFGDPAAAEAVTVWPGPWTSPVLLLPRPARSVAAVTVGGDVAAGAITGATALAAGDWTPWFGEADGSFRALRSLTWASWPAPVVVTADWADRDDDAAVPPEVVEAVTILVVGTWRRDHGGLTEETGPDGLPVAVPDAWHDERVRRAIRIYGGGRRRIAV